MLVATLGGDTLAWSSPQIIALALAVPAVRHFWCGAQLVAPEPVLPLRLLDDGLDAGGHGVNFCQRRADLVRHLLHPAVVQEVSGLSPTAAGFTLMPLGCPAPPPAPWWRVGRSNGRDARGSG
ncbi:MAG: hypothetical protein R2704_11960 [Microthrixaceae bacterium]